MLKAWIIQVIHCLVLQLQWFLSTKILLMFICLFHIPLTAVDKEEDSFGHE
jgi:hypothetical protein